eukprot:gnl/Dysnectes_brevis/793_a874_2229.p1 GENE.gnl/Dysnectes_brevis/793_a874_2229~~gnl/Dysnectes_brevis/793_a874_2229.p1  ORF type:complete len:115 (-),score=32.16 gnl/Dysnectes_brevis/793_a874_2229:569-913(-)
MPDNIFEGVPQTSKEEIFTSLLTREDITRFEVERILSFGQSSPPDFWYDQEQGEFVVVLQGHATLQIKDDAGLISTAELSAGSFLDLPPHRPHRVQHTSSEPPCVWLAVHYWTG